MSPMLYDVMSPIPIEDDDDDSMELIYRSYYDTHCHIIDDDTEERVMSNANWYIVEVDDSGQAVQDISAMGIPCHDTDEHFTSSIAFPASNLDNVLQYLGKQGLSYSLEPTNDVGIFVMKFSGISDNISYDDKPTGPHLEGWQWMVPVIRDMYVSNGIKVFVDNPHGKVVSPIPSNGTNELYVHFWSTPKLSSKVRMNKACGVTLVEGQPDALKPSGLGTPIKDNDGNVIAEYLNDNLYVLFDLPHAEGKVVTVVFTRVMRTFLDFKGKSVNGLKDIYHSVIGSISTGISGGSDKDKFIASCSRMYERNLALMESKLYKYDATIDDYNQKLVENIRDREILMTKLEPLKESVIKRRAWAGNEYDTLMASPHVKNVIMNDSILEVYTDMITISHDGKNYDIGEFKIEIYTDGSKSVKAFNLTDAKSTVCHPHVKKDGHCCLGNIEHGVLKLLAECQYVILAQLMVTYLESYNPDSAYARVELWK